MTIILRECDISKMCRTCLATQTEMTAINTDIQNMLFDSAGIKMDTCPILPNKICMVCKHIIYLSYQFRQQCGKSNVILQNVFTSSDEEAISDEVKSTLPNDTTKTEIENHYNNENRAEMNKQTLALLENPPEKNENAMYSNVIENHSKSVHKKSIQNIVTRPPEKNENIIVSNVMINQVHDLNNMVSNKFLEFSLEPNKKIFVSSILENQSQSMNEKSSNEFISETTENLLGLNVIDLQQPQITEHVSNNIRILKRVANNRRLTSEEITNNVLTSLAGEFSNPKKNKYDSRENVCSTSTEMVAHDDTIDNSDEPFRCVTCNKVFKFQQELDLHRRRHARSEKRCDICGQIFYRTQNYHRHMRAHARIEIVINCSVCDAKFSCKKHYMLHRKTAHRMSPLDKQTCDTCGKAVMDVENHKKRMHTAERSFPCDKCEKSFTFAVELQRHVMLVHEQQQKYVVLCSICGKKSDCVAHLKVHMLSHTEEPSFQCHICNKKFKYPHGLSGHVRRHTDYERFRCNFCLKNFATLQTFKCHLRIHTGERPYACKLCDKAYIRSTALRNHMKTHSKIKE